MRTNGHLNTWDFSTTHVQLFPNSKLALFVVPIDLSPPNKVHLTANEFASIIIEYYERTADARIKLAWSSARQATEVIPPECLFRPAFISGSPFNINVQVGDTSKPVGNFSTAVAFGPHMARTHASVMSTIYVQAQDATGNHADHNRDIYILELKNVERFVVLNGTEVERPSPSFMSQPYENSVGLTYHQGGDPLDKDMAYDIIPERNIGLHRIDFIVDTVGMYDVTVYSVTNGGSVLLGGFPKTAHMMVDPGPVSATSFAAGCWNNPSLCLSLPYDSEYTFTAGTRSTFRLELKDAFGNPARPIDPARITVFVEWSQYSTCWDPSICNELFMSRLDDSKLVSNTFPGFLNGYVEPADIVTWPDGAQTCGPIVTVHFTALRQGHSFLHVKIDDKPILQSPIRINGLWNPQPAMYTLLENKMPPAVHSLAGQGGREALPIRFRVLLRDRFANPIERELVDQVSIRFC